MLGIIPSSRDLGLSARLELVGPTLLSPEGPRTQIIVLWGPNTIDIIVFGHQNPINWVLGPLGFYLHKKARVFTDGSRPGSRDSSG